MEKLYLLKALNSVFICIDIEVRPLIILTWSVDESLGKDYQDSFKWSLLKNDNTPVMYYEIMMFLLPTI